MANGNGDSNGNGEKRTLKRLLSIAVGIVGTLFGLVCMMIAMMWSDLAGRIDDIDARSQTNREAIIRFEERSGCSLLDKE